MFGPPAALQRVLVARGVHRDVMLRMMDVKYSSDVWVRNRERSSVSPRASDLCHVWRRPEQ